MPKKPLHLDPRRAPRDASGAPRRPSPETSAGKASSPSHRPMPPAVGGEDDALRKSAGPIRPVKPRRPEQPVNHPRLLADRMITITRLARDKAGRGELKMIASAIKELRYAFKVFAPYAHIRKVSIFGSSRTPCDHPEYVHADAVARKIRERKWMVITGAGPGAEKEINIAEIEQEMFRAGLAAELLAMGDFIRGYPGGQEYAKERYTYVAKTFPETEGGRLAKKRLDNLPNK